jgi:hypothetical protein
MKRNWKVWRPQSLQEAVEGCVQYAQAHDARLGVERVGDLVGESKWTVYKWMETGAIPARKIPGFEHACGRPYITEYLALSAHKLVVDMPSGRVPSGHDIQALQQACHDAVGALLAFSQQRLDAQQTIDSITAAMTRLAHERAQVERSAQPELSL